MKRAILGLALASLFGVAQAQTAISGAASGSAAKSAADAAAVSGAAAGATGGSVNITTPANTTLKETFDSHSSNTSVGVQDNNTNFSGSYKLSTTPGVVVPNIFPTSPCMGTTSAGFSITGFGIGGGTSWKDDDCGIRETARVFIQANMPQDGLAVLCSSPYAKVAPSCAKYVAQKVSDARDPAVRDSSDRGRAPTISKSETDRALTEAAMKPTEKERQAANCAFAERSQDEILAQRFDCPRVLAAVKR